MKQSFIKTFLQQKHPSKWVYKKFQTLNEYHRGHEIKWAEILDKEISESDWSKYYQIVTRTIPTNRFLSRCKLVESDKYWYCKESIETVDHLFLFCPVVKM